MDKKRRWTVRHLLVLIGILAVVLWIIRAPLIVYRDFNRFRNRSRQGEALIKAYGPLCPKEFSPQSWDQAVGVVHTAWVDVVFWVTSVPEEDLDAILEQMRDRAARASPATAEAELYFILDLLAHAPTHAGDGYLVNMRLMLKQSLQERGRPSPGLIQYARTVIGSTSADPVPDLEAALGHKDWPVRVACCRALREIGLGGRAAVVVPPLIKALRNDDALMREIAIESLGSLGPDKAGKAVPELIRMFGSDPSQRLRLHAAWALPRLDPEGTAAIPALVAGLNDRNWQMRLSAVSTVGQFGLRARSAVPGLIASLSDSEAYVRSAAAAALAKIGPASRTVPPLIEAYRRELRHGDWTVSYMIAIALGQIGPEAAPAVPALVEGLKTGTLNDRSYAAQALGKIGPGAGPALPALLNALHDPGWSVRQEAAESIILVGADPELVIPPLIAALRDDMDYVRAAAAVSLGRLGPAARAAIPRLIELQNDEASRTREEAKKALEQIGDQS